MAKSLTFVLALGFGLFLCFGSKAAAINGTCSLKDCEGTMLETSKEVYLVKNPVKKGGNGHQPSKMPVRCKMVLFTGTAMSLYGQFDSSVLTLLSANGQQLYQVAIPEGADEVDIPVLSDVPVEVHINDGVNDYYGYIE